LQYCFTWIWDEELSKYVDEMVIHKTASKIRGLREALEASINQVHLKEDLIRARDVQLEFANNEIVTLKTKLGETGASLNTFKMLFWGMIFLFIAGFVAVITM